MNYKKRLFIFSYFHQHLKHYSNKQDYYWIKHVLAYNRICYHLDQLLLNKHDTPFYNLDFLHCIIKRFKPDFLIDFFESYFEHYNFNSYDFLETDEETIEPRHYERLGYLIMQMTSFANHNTHQIIKSKEISKNVYLYEETKDLYYIRDYGVYFKDGKTNEVRCIFKPTTCSIDFSKDERLSIWLKFLKYDNFSHLIYNEKYIFDEYNNVDDIKDYIKLNFGI